MGHFQQHSYSLGRVQIFPLFFHTWRQQGCFCTRLFTRLLQGCLQGCYKVVTRLVTRLLQGCYKVVTRLLPCQLHTCNQVVTRLLHNLVATLLQGCYNLVFSVWERRPSMRRLCEGARGKLSLERDSRGTGKSIHTI